MRSFVLLAAILSQPSFGCRQAAGPPSAPSALALAPLLGSGRLETEIAALQASLRRHPDAATWVKLAGAFVRKARETSDAGYYARADEASGQALLLDEGNGGALQVRQLVLLNGHRFAEAKSLAERQLRRRPRDEVAWGALGDSALELGDYETAAVAYQNMLDIRPDLRSYSRGAWMRWLTGDSDGALELMELAVASGGPRDPEARAYCRVQLGELYTNLGRFMEAQHALDRALQDSPGYGPAYLTRGRLSLLRGNTQDALADLSAAMRIQPLAAVRAAYIDALLFVGHTGEAAAEAALLAREGRSEDPRTLSLFYSTLDQEPALALALAKDELMRRPDLFSYDAMAWALYRNGRLDEAWDATLAATRLGTKDPRLLFHRGQIAAAQEKRGEARASLLAVLAQNPHWDLREPAEARATLAALGVDQ